MQRCVNVIGVGMSPFGPAALGPYQVVLVGETVRQALADAGLSAQEVGAVFATAGSMDGGTLQRTLERTGLGHVPLHRLPEDGTDGCTLLFRARQAIELGIAECVLVLGVQSAPVPVPDLDEVLERLSAVARQYQTRHQARRETFAMVAVKARQHAAFNPWAVFNHPLTLDEVLQARVIAEPLTHPQYAWPSSGSAAVLLSSADFARCRSAGAAVQISAQACVSPAQLVEGEQYPTFASMGYEVNVASARELYEQAGWGPQEVDVCELHDSSTLDELLLYEALGFCPEGNAEKLVEDGDNTYGGNLVINPSGGLLSLGQAPAVSGLAQCIELVLHLRGQAGRRQVAGARIALQHQAGGDGTVVSTLYQRT